MSKCFAVDSNREVWRVRGNLEEWTASGMMGVGGGGGMVVRRKVMGEVCFGTGRVSGRGMRVALRRHRKGHVIKSRYPNKRRSSFVLDRNNT